MAAHLKGITLALLLASRAVHADEAAPTALEPVTVTAERSPADAEDVPAAVSALPAAELERAGVESVKDASLYAPSVNLIEFTARAISNPQVRGVGGSTTNPGVTTYIDGVPQLSADTSSRELVDVDRIEFVRGAQGTLFGRNTLGGVIQVLTRAPAQARLQAGGGIGDHARREARGVVAGPLLQSAGISGSLAGGHASRDGYSVNTVTSNTVDDRSANFGQAQLAWVGSRAYVRALAGVESAHDGGFALADLAALRARPYSVSYDYEGYTRRLIQSQTLLAGFGGEGWAVENIAGHVAYTAFETVDLDLTPEPELTRDNLRVGSQWTEELRVLSTKPFVEVLGLGLSVQAGVFGFEQDNDQDAANHVSRGYLIDDQLPVLGLTLPPILRIDIPDNAVAPARDRTHAILQDRGYGIYAALAADWSDTFRLSLGVRHDREHKQARITREFVLPTAAGEIPLGGEPPGVDGSRDYSATSPRATLRWRVADDAQVYGSIAAGYRSGGFNAQSPAGAESYGEERSRNLEIGAKMLALDRRLQVDVAAFDIRLQDLQLNVPIPGGGARFYIANAGRAASRGLELEARARPWSWLTLFGSAAVLDARFDDGSQELGENVSGKRLPYAEPFTATLGMQTIWRSALGEISARIEGVRAGGGWYDAGNHERQTRYWLANARVGWRYRAFSLEAWGRNLTDAAVIPLAIPYGDLTPSGYAGENAPPRTVGVSLALHL